jgi:hypothetical protein
LCTGGMGVASWTSLQPVASSHFCWGFWVFGRRDQPAKEAQEKWADLGFLEWEWARAKCWPVAAFSEGGRGSDWD